jgi:hypothetical protein
MFGAHVINSMILIIRFSKNIIKQLNHSHHLIFANHFLINSIIPNIRFSQNIFASLDLRENVRVKRKYFLHTPMRDFKKFLKNGLFINEKKKSTEKNRQCRANSNLETFCTLVTKAYLMHKKS